MRFAGFCVKEDGTSYFPTLQYIKIRETEKQLH